MTINKSSRLLVASGKRSTVGLGTHTPVIKIKCIAGRGREIGLEGNKRRRRPQRDRRVYRANWKKVFMIREGGKRKISDKLRKGTEKIYQ